MLKKKEVAPVYNANHSKGWEEEITDIHKDPCGNTVGVVEQSIGKAGKEMKVYKNTYYKTWEYKNERK